MLSCLKPEDKLILFHNETIHSHYKERISLFVEPTPFMKRYQSQAPLNKKQNAGNCTQYSSYPSVFKNKTSNIRRILKNRNGSANFEKIFTQKKENKFHLVLQDHFNQDQYYNYQYTLRGVKLKNKTVNKIGNNRQNCRESTPTQFKQYLQEKKTRGNKRRQFQRLTEPFEGGCCCNMVGVGFCKKQDEISLSPWGY